MLHEIISYGKLQNLTLLQRRMRRQKRGRLKAQWRRNHCHIHIILLLYSQLAMDDVEVVDEEGAIENIFGKWEFLCRENETCEYHSELSMQ